MAVLDNAVWLGGGGSAVSGTTTLDELGNSTVVTGTFTGSWGVVTNNGNTITEFGAFAATSANTATYDFSNPIENLSFQIDHLNDDGASTYDDFWTIEAYDENGVLIPAATVISGLSGLVDENVIINADGTVSIEAVGTTSNDVSVDLAGPISSLTMTLQPGPGGTQTGGSGISDLTFDIPLNDIDGDGVHDDVDIDIDGDGILNTDEGLTTTTPSTITITFDGDQWAAVDNTRWELRDPDGDLIASDSTIDNTSESITIPVSGLGDYTFTVRDDYGDGISGGDPAGITIEIDGTTVYEYDPATDPNFGTQLVETFTVAEVETSLDSDGDGIADHLDLDSDNDGITDNVEAQTTADYVAPTGIDSDGDGLDDAYEGTGNEGLTPVNTDGDGFADYLDGDSDDDGISDTDEAGHGVSQADIDASGDADGDGIKDVVDNVIGWDVNDADVTDAGDFTLADTDNDTAADGSNALPMTRDLDYRDTVPCFTPGAMILTPNGERSIETLRVGDLVVTKDHGPQPVRWIGERSVVAKGRLAPVLITSDSLPGATRPLLVSPQHRFLMNGYQADLLFGTSEVFVSAKHLVSSADQTHAHPVLVTYMHLMFDEHEVIFANGVATESFHAGAEGLSAITDHSRNEMFAIFPELRSNIGTYGQTARVCLSAHEARVLRECTSPRPALIAA